MEQPSPNETHTPFIDSALTEPKEKSGSLGSVLAILLIVFLLVIGAFYVWGQRISEQRSQQVVPAAGT